ncbi:MAG TPA: YkgJ family cysteine cluster protein [Bacteriovoracaceae bacterium]|nr:YkgJ family cysteine cluster protein [Bacteriovoracaceae bacterium]
MNIREFSFNLQKVYEEMTGAFSELQAASGLACIQGCGKCCQNPEVEASVLEMIPFALKIYDEGKFDEWIERLTTTGLDHCLLFEAHGSSGGGRCSSYAHRPSVCRMFGVAGYFNKHHQVVLSVCKFIKENNPQNSSSWEEPPSNSIPIISTWSTRLSALDPDLCSKKLPINQAILQAMQRVGLYAQYEASNKCEHISFN